MSIPFSERCPNCNGTGRVWCPVCGGTGKASNERDRERGDECSYCRGQRPAGTVECGRCRGSGTKD